MMKKNRSLEQLKKAFTGEIILPGDSNYDHASGIFTFKGSPCVIFVPLNHDDISSAISYAKEHSLLLSIRSGGHSGAGFSTNEGGVVIDLSKINTVKVIDEKNHIVRIGTGAKWGQVAEFLQTKGLSITSGDTKTVGVGGLTLGGGIGWMVRKYGLTIDNVVAAEIVTADGTFIRTTETEHPDLFWAIRGGGGNFGVVTHIEIKAHPVANVFFGTIMYSFDNVSEILKRWRNHMEKADESLTTTLMLMPSMAGNPPGIMILCCYSGDDETAAMSAIEPLKKIGTMLSATINKLPYAAVLQDAHPPTGVQIVVKSMFVDNCSDELIQVIEKTHGKESNRFLMIRSIGGVINTISEDKTAFAYRNSTMLFVAPIFVPPTMSDQEVKKMITPWDEIEKFGKGAYAGFLSTVTEEDVKKIYPKVTYERLSKIKKKYDPLNIFNQNYNIKP